MVNVSPKVLAGPWKAGFALDVQIVSSTYIGDNQYGHPQFDSKRSDIGELLYQLKYNSDKSTIAPIAETAVVFIKEQKWAIDVVVPVPPSRFRAHQPVLAIGQAIAKSLAADFSPDCVVRVKKIPELKNVHDFDKRKE